MPFGQIVIGSPGSGKTTYCTGLQQFLTALKRPNVHVVNLDFANSQLPYPCAIDVNALISVRDVMMELDLGPNGAMMYCMEYLEENIQWLLARLKALGKDAYVVFDLPGQVEISTNHPSLGRILNILEKEADFRLVAMHLLDSSHILDPSRYVSLLLLSLRAMLSLELPHINVLTKVDLLGQASGGELPFPLDFYTDPSPSQFAPYLESHSTFINRSRYSSLNEKILEIIDDFSLVSFETLAVEDKESMWRLVRLVDKVGGWVFVHAGEMEMGSDLIVAADDEDGDVKDEMPSQLRAALEQGYLDDNRPSGSAASALSLFTTLDSGAPMGWGSAEDVQERYVDSFKGGMSGVPPVPGSSRGHSRNATVEEGMTEEEFEQQEEERIYSAWREWRREEEEKKRSGKGQQVELQWGDRGSSSEGNKPPSLKSSGGTSIDIKERRRGNE